MCSTWYFYKNLFYKFSIVKLKPKTQFLHFCDEKKVQCPCVARGSVARGSVAHGSVASQSVARGSVARGSVAPLIRRRMIRRHPQSVAPPIRQRIRPIFFFVFCDFFIKIQKKLDGSVDGSVDGRLIYFRPLFEVKIGVDSWVSRGRRPRPAAGRANPTGNPYFNLKKRSWWWEWSWQ
jgi:hypothetical protein